MKNVSTFILCLFLGVHAYAQAYVVNHFQSSYDTLVGFNSATLELQALGEDPNYWEKTFNFGFNFPFFGQVYTEVDLDVDGIGYFDPSLDFNLFLFGSQSMVIGDIVNPSYLSSEIRYKYQISGSRNTLVVEYHNVYIDDEYDMNGPNHFINFQVWFYDDGVIELHFGDIDLANCSYYFPGQGFSFDNQNPTGNIYGPYVTIVNEDLTEGACFTGNHASPTILYDDDDNCNVLESIPPSGFVVQFEPIITSANGVEAAQNFQVIHEDDRIFILGESNCFTSWSMYDLVGRKISHSVEREFQFSSSNPRVVFIQVEGDCGSEVHKVILK